MPGMADLSFSVSEYSTHGGTFRHTLSAIILCSSSSFGSKKCGLLTILRLIGKIPCWYT